MKRLILLFVFLMFVCVGCKAMVDSDRFRESVVREFPNFKVANIPGEPKTFLVKDKDGNLWAVKTHNFWDADISSVKKINGLNCKD